MARLSAGVRKRSDGTLEKRFTVNGKRISVYGRTNKELAEKEQQARKDAELVGYTNNKNITLDKYFTEWVEGRRAVVKSSTLRIHKSSYNNHIKASLGSRRINKIERREIVKLQTELASKYTAATCNSVMRTIKAILNDAVKDDIIVKSPANNISAIQEKEKASETYHRALTEKEQADFMQASADNYYYEYFAFALCTGMRSGEIGALTWQDIDYKNNVIHVNKTITLAENNKVIVSSPKSKTSKRDIPLTDTVKMLLKQVQGKDNIVSFGTKNVFVTPYGHTVSNVAVNREIKRILKGLEEKGINIEHFTMHAFRDTFATRFIEQGGSPQTLKTILGHSSLAMTMDLYAHVLPNTKQKEMEMLKISI